MKILTEKFTSLVLNIFNFVMYLKINQLMRKLILPFVFLFLLNSITLQAQDHISKSSMKFEIGLREKPSVFSSFFDTIPKDAEVMVTDFKNNLWEVSYFDLTGWVPQTAVYETMPMRHLRNDLRKMELVERYGEESGLKINSGHVWIGMDKEMLLESKGDPKTKNISTGAWGKHEQWVYSDKYVYLEEGVVTSIQSSF